MSGGITLPVAGGASIAFNSQAFNTNPTWNSNLDRDAVSIQIDRGRNYLLSKTQTGTMTISFYSTTGKYDPTNANGPFYQEIGPMRSVNYQLQNPVDNSFHSLFTGFTNAWQFTYPATPSEVIMESAVSCVDGFDPLSRAEFVPDPSNVTTFAAIATSATHGAIAVRIAAMLYQFSGSPPYYNSQAYPTDTAAIFSGNVNILSAVYNPQTSILTGLQDAADAEIPFVSNLFMDKFGNVAFRGRATRFTPEQFSTFSTPTISQPISFWNVGDANACATWPTNPPGSPTTQAMAPFSNYEWDIDETNLVNVCQCYPGSDTVTSTINQQMVTNPLSIQKNGPRNLSIPNLYTGSSPAITSDPFQNPPGLTPNQECLLYADSFVNNLGTAKERISTLTFQTQNPGTTQGNQWWKMVTGIELGDVLIMYTTNPGGGGFQAEQFFVEGLHYTITPGGQYPQITMTVDVSPRSWFSYFNGFIFYPTNGFFAQTGNPTHSSNVFNDSVNNPFTINSVGQTLIIFDNALPASPGSNPQRFTITGFTNPSTVTMNTTWTGTTTSVAPYEIIGI